MSAPDPSRTVAAIEADIAASRGELDAALADIRRQLALPAAVARGAAAMLKRTDDTEAVRDFARRNAVPLGLVGIGAGWLAVQNRAALGELVRRYGGDFVERARAIAGSAVAAAFSAAAAEVARPDIKTADSEAAPEPTE